MFNCNMKSIIWKIYHYFALIAHVGVNIRNEGEGTLKTDIRGNYNTIEILGGAKIDHPLIIINGNNNRILIGKNCKIRKGTIFRIDGDNVTISIGDNTTLQHDDIIVAQHADIHIGTDCMFSNHIHIRSSESHPIYDNETREWINRNKEVKIGNHVWLAANCKILKGVSIHDDAVVGAHSVVTKDVLPNTIVAGNPARTVKNNVTWERSLR